MQYTKFNLNLTNLPCQNIDIAIVHNDASSMRLYLDFRSKLLCLGDMQFPAPVNIFMRDDMMLEIDLCVVGGGLHCRINQLSHLFTGSFNAIEPLRECSETAYQPGQAVNSTDVLIAGYQAFDYLQAMLMSLARTYDPTKIQLGKIIYCDNNLNSDDIAKSKDIFQSHASYLKNIAECIYIENGDKTYVGNRASSIMQSLAYCDADTITIVDSDTIFLTHKWQDSYKAYALPHVEACTPMLSHVDAVNNMTSHSFIFPRVLPYFTHMRREVAQGMAEQLRDPFGDSIIDTGEGISLIGYHGSKVAPHIFSRGGCLHLIGNLSDQIAHFGGRSFGEFFHTQNQIAHRNRSEFDQLNQFIAKEAHYENLIILYEPLLHLEYLDIVHIYTGNPLPKLQCPRCEQVDIYIINGKWSYFRFRSGKQLIKSTLTKSLDGLKYV